MILLLYELPIINFVLLTSISDDINVSLVSSMVSEIDVDVKTESAAPSFVKPS